MFMETSPQEDEPAVLSFANAKEREQDELYKMCLDIVRLERWRQEREERIQAASRLRIAQG
jgi:hypothetical protein